MTDIRRRWLGNSLVNLIGGLATAGVNVLLPAIVVKHLSTEAFSVWNLALQMLVYVNLLGLGLQTAVARAMAHAVDNDAGSGHSPEMILRSARSLARWASLLGILVVFGLVAAYPLLFPGLSPALVPDFRWTLLLFGFAAVLQILAQVDMGLFQGLHRNRVFVGVQTLVRLTTVLAVWCGAVAGASLVGLALLMASTSALLWPFMAWVARRTVPWARTAAALRPDSACRRELLQYCGTLSVWSVSMMLVNSTGIVIVARLDLLMAGPYAVATTAAAVLVGLLNAALSPLMTTGAGLYANAATRSKLPALLTRATTGTAIALNGLFLFLLCTHDFVLTHWVGASFVKTAGPLMIILVGAHCLRNIAAPYSLMLLASGLQRRALVSAVLESVANLVASALLGVAFGAIGVALGTLVGAIVGVAGTLLLNSPRTPDLTPRPMAFVLRGFALPLGLFVPMYFLWLPALLGR